MSLAIDGGFSTSKTEAEVVGLAVETHGSASEGAKMLQAVQAEGQPTDPGFEGSEGKPMAAMGEDWLGYCRKCQQRHCCEALER